MATVNLCEMYDRELIIQLSRTYVYLTENGKVRIDFLECSSVHITSLQTVLQS